MSQSIEALEVKVAFLEEALQQLSDEHFRQQKDLSELKANYKSIMEKYINQSDEGDSLSEFSSLDEEKPPHY